MGATGSKPGDPVILPKCPAPFESAGNLTCVMPCPADKGFERSGLKCVYKSDPKVSVTLKSLGAPFFSGTTLDDLKKADTKAYTEFVTEQDRLKNELNVVYANMDKEKKLADAFKALQAAENARDTAPTAYQQARTAYYTLLKGDSWKEEERTRIAKAEVDPLIQKYKDSKEGALTQYNNQQKTVDVVNGLKDKVLSLKDEFKYSVDTFTDQLEKVKNAIQVERRGREKETKVSPWSWLDVILNAAIVLSLIYAGIVLFRKVFARPVVRPAVIVR